MKLFKRIFGILLALILCIGVFPMSVFADGEIKITPSATDGTYDESTNTLTVVGGGEVSFTPSSGIEFESVAGTKQPKDGEDTTVDDNVSAVLDGTKWIATLPNENAEYIFRGYYKETDNNSTSVECTVVVTKGVTLTFYPNGGVSEINKVAIQPQTKFEVINELYIPTRAGYTFLGWSLWPEGPAERSDRLVKNDCELYAIWAEGIVIREKDIVDKVVYIVGRKDIADGSISNVDMKPVFAADTITNDQAVALIDGWKATWHASWGGEDTYEDYIRLQLKDYTLADLAVIRNSIERCHIPNDFISDAVEEEIASRVAAALVIAPGYIDSTSDFKVTTGQGLGVTYSNDALRDLLTSVGTGSNIKVATKFEKAEITRDEAKIIVAEWAEIVNTAEGEEQIKNLLLSYSIYELALLQQYTNILDLDDSTAQKLYELMRVERDKKKEEAATKDNEEPLAAFSVNTYAVAADGTQSYIPVKKSMQYAIPVDTSGIPENATLALYRVDADGTRTKQQIISIENGVVLAETDGNSDYVLVYELAETDGLSVGAIIAIVAAGTVVLAGGGFALYWFIFNKKKA